MTDYGPYYFNYTTQTWSTDSSNLVAIPADGTIRTLMFYPADWGCTTKSGYAIDKTTVQSYSGSSWMDMAGYTVSGTGDYQFYTSGYTPAQIKLRVNPTTNGTFNLFLGVKHSGAWAIEYGVKFVVKVASVTSIGLNTRVGDTIYTQATYGSAALSPVPSYTRTGYKLQGWYTSTSGGTKVINSDGSLVSSASGYTNSSGQWTYTGSTLTLYAQYTESVYTMNSSFVNCVGSLAKNGGTPSASVSSVRYESDTVTISWTAPEPQEGYQFAFDYMKVYTIVSGVKTPILSSTSDTGTYTFRYSDTGVSVAWPFLQAVVRYKKNVKVVLISDDSSQGLVQFSGGSSGASVEKWVDVTSGSATVNFYANAKTGYMLDQWSDGNVSTHRAVSVSANVTYTAYFTVVQYTTSVSAGSGGSISEPSTGCYTGSAGDRFRILAVPSAGYMFEKWTYYSYSGTLGIDSINSADTMATLGSSSDSITANFKVATSTIVLDANAQDGTNGSGTIQANATSISVSTAPSRTDTHYTLSEFYMDAACTKRIAYKSSSTWRLDTSVVYGGVTYTDSSGRWQMGDVTVRFYAKWQGTTMTATFNANGGTVSPSTKTVEYGSAYGELPTPTNTDESKSFGGWWMDGSEVTSETIVAKTSAHTLTAEWLSGLIVTFNANGGYCDTPRKAVTHGSTYGTLPTPTWTGHTFGGWWTAETGGTEITSSTTVSITENQTLYAHWTVPTHTFRLSYNANGGSGAPSTVTWTGEGDSHQFTVSSTVPTKTGNEFLGWAKSSVATYPEYLPNSNIIVEWNGSSAQTTLYAVWTGIEPPVEDAEIDSTRIYKADSSGKAPGTAYIDVTSRLSVRPTIKEVENYGTTASFTIINGETSTDNLLASTCVWSSGTGAISTGQFVRIRHGSATGMSWGWFFITSIAVSDDLVTVTCGDYIQWLRANGSDYYRNHYDPTGYENPKEQVRWEANTSPQYLYIEKPSDVSLIGGATGDVKIMVPGTEIHGSSNPADLTKYSFRTYIPLRSVVSELPDNRAVAITSIKAKVSYGGVKASLYFDDNVTSEYCFGTGDLVNSGGFNYATLSLPNPIYVGNCHGITVVIEAKVSTSTVRVQYGSESGVSTYYKDANYSEETELANTSIDMTLGCLLYENASGAAVTGYPTRWKITSTDSVSSPDETLAAPVYNGDQSYPRGSIEYLDPLSGVAISEIVRNICGAADCSVAIGSMNRKVQMFRCGGSYYHDYLLALADMTEDDNTGRRHSFCASTSSWASLMFGLRRKATDSSMKYLVYGRDKDSAETWSSSVNYSVGRIVKDEGSAYIAISSGTNHKPSQSPTYWTALVPMMSFNPRKTMQYRPCKAVSKGLDNNGNPIIVCVKDPDVKLGSSAVTVESTDTSSAQAGLNAYNSIMTNRSTDWEGEIVLDGVHPEYMTRSGVYIGGNVVTIYDSRYSMNGLKARVREATFDYQNLTTTLVLSNYTEVYSNSINDTSKMAYTSGTLSLAASGEDLYLRQYVFIDVTGQMTVDPSSTHSMTIHVSGASEPTQSVSAECIAYPELGICTLVGYFAPGTAYSTDQYAVDKVTVDSTEISINSYRRPDKRDEQYVIVNVQCSI